MDFLLTLAGLAILLVTTADIFFNVLFPASGHGPVRKPLSATVWLLFRLLGAILHGRPRRNFLSYSGPMVISATLVGWFLLLNAGFALVFKPALGTAIVADSGPTDTSWAAAFYYSGFNITTLGVGDLTPATGAFRILTVAAAATGFAYFSMSITYFLSVYSHLTGRNAYARGLYHLTGRSGDAAVLIARLAEDETLAAPGSTSARRPTTCAGSTSPSASIPCCGTFTIAIPPTPCRGSCSSRSTRWRCSRARWIRSDSSGC